MPPDSGVSNHECARTPDAASCTQRGLKKIQFMPALQAFRRPQIYLHALLLATTTLLHNGCTMATRILMVLAHPRKDSYCGALAAAYRQGAAESGAELREMVLADEHYELNVLTPSPRQQHLEDSVKQAQQWILWAEHIVFVYPPWWGTLPALLKGFLDRVFMPGYAFNETEHAGQYELLLRGLTAELLVTMDTPPWVYRWIYRQPGHNAMQRSTLCFCGVRPTRIHTYGPVKDSAPAQREQWLEEARTAGRTLRHWRDSVRMKEKIGAWLALLRLQFYPMTFIAYAIGALAAGAHYGSFNAGVFWLGYLCLFLLEAITVFSNEYFDFESDRLNKNAGQFTGGSRVLVDGRLSFDQLRRGVAITTGMLLVAGLFLFNTTSGIAAPEIGVLVLAGLVFTIGYTTPPTKWVYRGFGEVNVALTHSFLVILCGYAFQSGVWSDPYPWLISIPLFLATLPAITLSAIPDYDADKAVGKRTLAVRLGMRSAAVVAGVSARLASFAGLGLRDGAGCRKIDGLMTLSLTFVLWFGLIPLIDLLNRR